MLQPVSHLSVHPAVALAWQMPDDHPRFRSLVESIREQGVLEALKVTEAGEVVDGRHRLRAAGAAGLEMVECQVVPADRVAAIALATLVERRHLVSRGQLAYASYPLFAAGHREAQERHAEALRRGAIAGADTGSGTVEEFAAQLGISRDLFKQAARLHALFDENRQLAAEWEPKIMAAEDPIGLGAAIAGIRGQEASTDRTPARNTALHNWEVAWRNITRPAASWERWSAEEREYASQALRDQFGKLPDPVLDAVSAALRAARRARAYAQEKSPEGRLESLGLLTPRNEGGDPSGPHLPAEARERIAEAAQKRWARFTPGTPVDGDATPERA